MRLSRFVRVAILFGLIGFMVWVTRKASQQPSILPDAPSHQAERATGSRTLVETMPIADLPYADRKAVYRELQTVYFREFRAAAERHPMVGIDASEAERVERERKVDADVDAVEQAKRQELMERYEITSKDIDWIIQEGMLKNWEYDQLTKD